MGSLEEWTTEEIEEASGMVTDTGSQIEATDARTPDPMRAPNARRVATDRMVLLSLLRSSGGMTTTQVADAVGLNQPTASKVLKRLGETGEIEKPEGSKGPWLPERETSHAIGISLRGYAVRQNADGGFARSWTVSGTVTNRAADPKSIRLPVPRPEDRDPDTSYTHVLDVTVAKVKHLQQRALRSGYDVTALGVALGGHVDGALFSDANSSGTVVFSPNFGWWTRPLARDLSRRTGIRTVVENDANAFARWESFTSDRESKFAVLLVSEFIGAAVIDRQRLIHGATGGAGEVGHLPFAPKGKRCICGRRGCVTTVASYMAIREEAFEKKLPAHVSDVVRQADDGVETAQRILNRAAQALSLAVVALEAVVEPRVIFVISTPLEESRYFQRRLTALTDEQIFESFRPQLRFIPASAEHEERGAAWAAIVKNL